MPLEKHRVYKVPKTHIGKKKKKKSFRRVLFRNNLRIMLRLETRNNFYPMCDNKGIVMPSLLSLVISLTLKYLQHTGTASTER